MADQTEAALVGGIGAAAAVVVQRLDRNSDRSRDAKQLARDAQDSVEELKAQILPWRGGDYERVSADRVADALGGIAYGTRTVEPQPETFATLPQPLPRPVMTRDLAQNVAAYPGNTNAYTPGGKLVNPGEAFEGQQFGMGVALASAETRAALMGLMQPRPSNPSAEHLGKIFDFFRSLGIELENGDLTTESIRSSVHALLSSQFGSRKLGQYLSTGAIITGASTETIVYEFLIPAGTLRNPGDQLMLRGYGRQISTNAADVTTERVRLNGSAGTILAEHGANFGAGVAIIDELTFTYLPGQIRASGLMLPNGTPASPLVAFDPTVENRLTITVQHGTNNAANQTRYDEGTLFLVK